MNIDEHHAILFLGPYERALSLLPEDCRSESADVHIRRHEKFTIKEARALREAASSRPVARARRTFIISADHMLREAQQALLKLFEDPPEATQFFLLLEDDRELLPTVRSRFHVVHVDRAVSGPGDARQESHQEARQFLSLSYADRLGAIAKRHAAKDTLWMEQLMRALIELEEESIRKNNKKTVGSELLLMEEYMRAQGASKKMLLEHLALSLA